MANFQHIVILTGAGLSAESGLATFRDKDGIWAKYDYREVATPEGFRRNPRLVHDFYNQRRRGLEGVVTVRLQLDAGGKVAGLDVEDGAPLLLAKATQEAVKRAGPFPPPPDGLGVLRIPVRYRLTD